MFQMPSDCEEALLGFLTSFSEESGAFSSRDTPAMAESTLVSGADMVKDGEDER